MQQSTPLALYDALLILLDAAAAVAKPAVVVYLFPDIGTFLTSFVVERASRVSLHHCLQLYFLYPQASDA
jgi:hypothetical protein